MRSAKQARAIVVDTWTTITGNNLVPKIILNNSDERHTPYVTKEQFGDQISLSEITFPRRYWQDFPEEILRASIPFEMVNFFLDEKTPMEITMRREIDNAKLIYSAQPDVGLEQINLILVKYEVSLYITAIQLARKLKGDKSVYRWFIKAGYNSNWLIEFLELLIREAPQRIQPAGRIQPRIDGLQKRLEHLRLLIKGQTKKAKKFRDKQVELARKISVSYIPH